MPHQRMPFQEEVFTFADTRPNYRFIKLFEPGIAGLIDFLSTRPQFRILLDHYQYQVFKLLRDLACYPESVTPEHLFEESLGVFCSEGPAKCDDFVHEAAE